METLTVTVSYRERIALPPGSELAVHLLDQAGTGIPTRQISSQRYAMTGVPLKVTLSYDPQVMAEGSRHGVVASIFAPDGQEMFRTAAPFEIRPGRASAEVDLVLTMLSEAEVSAVPHRISGVSWTVTEIFGEAWPTEDAATLVIDDEGNLSLFGGCNRFRGQLQPSAGGLGLPENLAGTLMACPDEVEALERRVLAALRQVAGHVRYGSGLVMTDARGRAVLHFVETPE